MLSHARQLQKGRDSSMSALIDARGIEKSFMYGKGKKLRKNRVLNGIDFSVNVGEFVSIVGPSGSGKNDPVELPFGPRRDRFGLYCP